MTKLILILRNQIIPKFFQRVRASFSTGMVLFENVHPGHALMKQKSQISVIADVCYFAEPGCRAKLLSSGVKFLTPLTIPYSHELFRVSIMSKD